MNEDTKNDLMETELDQSRTSYRVAVREYWMAMEEDEDSKTLRHRHDTAGNCLDALQRVEKQAGRVC